LKIPEEYYVKKSSISDFLKIPYCFREYLYSQRPNKEWTNTAISVGAAEGCECTYNLG